MQIHTRTSLSLIHLLNTTTRDSENSEKISLHQPKYVQQFTRIDQLYIKL